MLLPKPESTHTSGLDTCGNCKYLILRNLERGDAGGESRGGDPRSEQLFTACELYFYAVSTKAHRSRARRNAIRSGIMVGAVLVTIIAERWQSPVECT